MKLADEIHNSKKPFINRYRLVPTLIAVCLLAWLVPKAISISTVVQRHDQAARSIAEDASDVVVEVHQNEVEIQRLNFMLLQNFAVDDKERMRGQIRVLDEENRMREKEMRDLLQALRMQIDKKSEGTTLWTVCIATVTFVFGTLVKPVIDVIQDAIKEWLKQRFKKPAIAQNHITTTTFNLPEPPKQS